MGLLPQDIRAAVTRALRRGDATTQHAADTVLNELGPDKVELLARYEGQSLDELEATFQLLPLGTRLALETVGALTLTDAGEPQFRVKALPFAVDLVQRAAERDATSTNPASRTKLQTELVTIQLQKAAMAETALTVEDAPAETKTAVAAALPEIEVLGVVYAKALTAIHESGSDMAFLDVLLHAGNSPEQPLRIACRMSNAQDLPSTGTVVQAQFVIAKPKRTRRTKTEQGLTAALRRSVLDIPGLTYARIDPKKPKGIAHFSIGDDANAVAQLTSVNGHPVEIHAS